MDQSDYGVSILKNDRSLAAGVCGKYCTTSPLHIDRITRLRCIPEVAGGESALSLDRFSHCIGARLKRDLLMFRAKLSHYRLDDRS